MSEIKPERACEVCGAHIDHDANPRKVHCSNKCTVAAYRARQKLKSPVPKIGLAELKLELLTAITEFKEALKIIKPQETK